MTENRFVDQAFESPAPISSGAFLLVPTSAVAASCPASQMHWLYQQLYAQAVQANQSRPALPELFSVMN